MEKPRTRVVGLYIEEERLRDHVKFILKAKGIIAEKVQGIQSSPFKVVLTDRRYVPLGFETKTATVEEGFSEEDLIWAIEVLEKLPSLGEEVVVGVDPGKKMGAAALCKNILIDSQVTDDTSKLVDWINRIRRIAETKILMVRVGRGERCREILEALEEQSWEGMEVEAVDESNTTKSLTQRSSRYGKDVGAAIRIALRV